jgi:hypothetical protein
MATRIKDFDKILPLILVLPVGTHFNCMQYTYGDEAGEIAMSMQAPTQREKEAIQRVLPALNWTGRYDETLKWWRYDAVTENGIALEIYAVKEAPAGMEVPA